MFRTHPPTRILTTTSLTPAQTHELLHTFLHFTSASRPLRNRKNSAFEASVPVVQFPPSVLNNLKRIEMGLRGEYAAPEKKRERGTGWSDGAGAGAYKRRRRNGDDDGGDFLPRTDAGQYLDGDGAEVGNGMEIQAGGREMRHDGDAVGEAPEIYAAGERGGKYRKAEKDKKKLDKKARRKAEQALRAEQKRKEKEKEEKEKEETGSEE